MQDDYFSLMQKIAPDLAQQIERRALVLERIDALQPVGRRLLASRLNLPEREVRTVAALPLGRVGTSISRSSSGTAQHIKA